MMGYPFHLPQLSDSTHKFADIKCSLQKLPAFIFSKAVRTVNKISVWIHDHTLMYVWHEKRGKTITNPCWPWLFVAWTEIHAWKLPQLKGWSFLREHSNATIPVGHECFLLVDFCISRKLREILREALKSSGSMAPWMFIFGKVLLSNASHLVSLSQGVMWVQAEQSQEAVFALWEPSWWSWFSRDSDYPLCIMCGNSARLWKVNNSTLLLLCWWCWVWKEHHVCNAFHLCLLWPFYLWNLCTWFSRNSFLLFLK